MGTLEGSLSQEILSSDKEKKRLDVVTKQSKKKLIAELKGSMGKSIKANPSRVHVRKVGRMEKIMNIIKSFLTRF